MIFTLTLISTTSYNQDIQLNPDSIFFNNNNQDTLNPTLKINKSVKKSFVIKGKVLDYFTQEPLEFVSIFFPKHAVGTKSDENGEFQFILQSFPGDTLAFSLLGYDNIFYQLDSTLPFQELNINMLEGSIQIRNVTVKFEKNPALSLVKRVIKNKQKNDFENQSNYRYEVYKKVEIDLTKIPFKSFKKLALLKKIGFIDKYLDTTKKDNPFLPLFLTESLADYYAQNNPKKSKEFIKATKISGVENSSVNETINSLYLNFNFYKNTSSIFKVDFISPIANDAPLYYKYKIVDTQLISDKLYYQVSFSPKRNGEKTFEGYFWVHDSDYAILKCHLSAGKNQNINWINQIEITQEFKQWNQSLWVPDKEFIYIDFRPPHGNKIAGTIARKTTSYQSFMFNQDSIMQIINNVAYQKSKELTEKQLNRDKEYWERIRHDTLSKNEQAIYTMIDTIQSLPIYKKYTRLIYTLTTGIINTGPIKIGSFYSFYSSNLLEGHRFKFRVYTTPQLFKNLMLDTYIAYGDLDKHYKYQFKSLWIIKNSPRKQIYLEYKHDFNSTINQYNESGSFDNIISNVWRMPNIPLKLYFETKRKIEILNTYHNGFNNTFTFESKDFTPYAPLPIIEKNGVPQKTIHNTEIGLETRYAQDEKFIVSNFSRKSLSDKNFIVKLYLGVGVKNIFQSDYNYVKLKLNISNKFQVDRLGSIFVRGFAGKIFGQLPYPALEIHPGNEYRYYNQNVFNLMNRYEFLSDQYIGCFVEHSMGSLFFKYIPYVRKANIRTFWNLRSVYGGLSAQNKQLNTFPNYQFSTLNNSPYIELGTGLENIFNLLRVDFVWKILPKQLPQQYIQQRHFGVFGSMKFAF
ncbi:MAG TPA: DUF5686 family protein [Chitinophagaceae bacterium]|nr:DUF5686 family protein [Chitinophagaceae bacterium]